MFICDTELFTVWGALIKKLGPIFDSTLFILENYHVANIV